MLKSMERNEDYKGRIRTLDGVKWSLNLTGLRNMREFTLGFQHCNYTEIFTQ
jgi:hypothetical protein